MITIWGRISSINVQKVVWAAEEVQVSYERREAGGKFGVVNSPAYLAMNPMGKVPTLVEDDFVLYESDSILRYLAAKYGKNGFFPESLRARAQADMWNDWQAKNYSPTFRDAFIGLMRTPANKQDHGAIAAALAASEPMMAILDQHLALQPYVTGQNFTYGDVAPGLAVHRWLHMPIKRSAMPHIEAYYQRLKARPASVKAFHLPVE